MNNTTTKRNLALAAVFMAATLVVGTFAVTTTTIATTGQSAFAYSQKKKGGGDNGKGNGNGNTVTIEECKNRGSASGFDTTTNQECENLICTHPGENATCTEEGVVVVTPTPPTPVKKTCEECFTNLLTQGQISEILGCTSLNLAKLCALLEQGQISEAVLRAWLSNIGVSGTTPNELIACLKNAGIVLPPG